MTEVFEASGEVASLGIFRATLDLIGAEIMVKGSIFEHVVDGGGDDRAMACWLHGGRAGGGTVPAAGKCIPQLARHPSSTCSRKPCTTGTCAAEASVVIRSSIA